MKLRFAIERVAALDVKKRFVLWKSWEREAPVTPGEGSGGLDHRISGHTAHARHPDLHHNHRPCNGFSVGVDRLPPQPNMFPFRPWKAGHNDISGHYVEVSHGDGWVTNYRHLVEQAPASVGAGVFQGQVIGKVGSTGWSTGPHLHIDLWNKIKQSDEAMYKNGWWAHDPELYLGKADPELDEDEVYEEDDEMIFLLAVEGKPDVYAWQLGSARAIHVDRKTFDAMKADGVHVLKVGQAGIDKLVLVE